MGRIQLQRWRQVALEVTPMIGGVFGNTTGVAPDIRHPGVEPGGTLIRRANMCSIPKIPLAISFTVGWS